MTDRRLQEAFAKEAASAAASLVTRAIARLESVSRATGERKFDPVIEELRQVRQKIVDGA